MELVRAAGVILFRRPAAAAEPLYLLMQTSYGGHHWTPPKGHVDPGENDFEAAMRETEEEAGLKLDKGFKLLDQFKVEIQYKVKHYQDGITRPKVVTYWLGEMVPGCEVTLSEEHQDFKWLPLGEACDLARFDNLQEALKRCDEKLKE